MSLTDIKEERSGHSSAVKFHCSKCDLSLYITDTSRKATTLAFASDLVGLDHVSLSKFCEVIGIEGPPDNYDSVYRNSDGTCLTRIPIKSDGTYQKRGYRSRGCTSKLGITSLMLTLTSQLIMKLGLNSVTYAPNRDQNLLMMMISRVLKIF